MLLLESQKLPVSRLQEMSSRNEEAASQGFANFHQFASATEEIENGLRSTLRKLATPVLEEIWEREVADLCGPRWHPAGRSHLARAGSSVTHVELGGQSISVRRPRVRAAAGREIELRSYRMVLEEDLLAGSVLEAIVMGATTGYTPQIDSPHERLGEFTETLSNHLTGLIWEPIREFGPTLVVGELGLRKFRALACVEITASGERSLLGIRAGSSAVETHVRDLLSQLLDRAPSQVKPRLLLAGESQTLHSALKESFDEDVPIQRCPIEKTREVLALLAPAIQAITMQEIKAAFCLRDADQAAIELERIASDLEVESTAAATTLRNGLEETLTARKLGFLTP